MAANPADDMRTMVLLETLRLAVPLHIDDMRHLDPQHLTRVAQSAAATVGSRGDDLQFGGRHCAEAFNALARGLAAAALVAWGGVTFNGLHWCPTPGCLAVDDDHPQPWPWTPRTVPPQRPVHDVPDALGAL
jgi:hypothetical protein